MFKFRDLGERVILIRLNRIIYTSIPSVVYRFVIETLTYICEVKKTIRLLEKDYLIILTKNIGQYASCNSWFFCCRFLQTISGHISRTFGQLIYFVWEASIIRVSQTFTTHCQIKCSYHLSPVNKCLKVLYVIKMKLFYILKGTIC